MHIFEQISHIALKRFCKFFGKQHHNCGQKVVRCPLGRQNLILSQKVVLVWPFGQTQFDF